MSVISAFARDSNFSFAAYASYLLAPDVEQLPLLSFFSGVQFQEEPMTLITNSRR